MSLVSGGQSGTSDAGTGGNTGGGGSSALGGNGSRESSEFEFVGNRQITPNPLFFHANQQPLLFQTVQETEAGVEASPPGRSTSPYTLTPSAPRATPTSPVTQVLSGLSSSGSSGSSKPIQTESVVTTVETPSPGMFGWVKGSGLFSKMVEKTRSVTTNVITTLDPQMKEFIQSGGDIQIVVASDKEDKVAPIREAFQNVFGQATVVGLSARSATIAEQPVGFASGRQSALERISTLRKCGNVEKTAVIVSVENFLYEVSEFLWLDFSCLLLSDPGRGINLQAYSQPTCVSSDQINHLKDATPPDYPRQWSGFAVPIGGVMAAELQVAPQQWQEAVTGVSRRRLLLLAGEALAGMYKRALRAKVDEI